MRDLQNGIRLEGVAKLFITVAAVLHLVFNYIHTSALLLLENEICGFLMFLFILFGLVALFEVTQIKGAAALPKLITALVCAVTDFFGWELVSIYQDRIQNQSSLASAEAAAPVRTAMNMSFGLMAAFGVAAVLLVVDVLLHHRRKS